MLKNCFFILFTSLFVYSCGSKQYGATSGDRITSTVLGKTDMRDIRYDRDSLDIMTPAIEIYDGRKHKIDYAPREEMINTIIDVLNNYLPKADYFLNDLMYKDALSVNIVLEGLLYEKNKFPELIISAPKELLITDKKYSLLIEHFGVYGGSNRSILYLAVINNSKKTVERVDRYESKDNPLIKELLKKRITNAIDSILKESNSILK